MSLNQDDNIPASLGCMKTQEEDSGKTHCTELDTHVKDKAITEFLSLKYVLVLYDMFGRFLTHYGLGKEERMIEHWYERREKGKLAGMEQPQ